MIKRTLLKELKELFRDGRIRITIGVIVLLLGTAIWVSGSQYIEAKANFEAFTEQRERPGKVKGRRIPILQHIMVPMHLNQNTP